MDDLMIKRTPATDAILKDHAVNALGVQNASNLSGVVHSFSRAMSALWEAARAEGPEYTLAVNTHPVAYLFAVQVSFLTGNGSALDHQKWEWAEKVCRQIAGFDD